MVERLRTSRRAVPGALCLLLWTASIAAQTVAPPVFVDITSDSNVTFVNAASHTSQKYLPETMVGGVAMLDYDQDGYLDLYFVNGAKIEDPMPEGKAPDKSDPRYWNRLYRNKGDLTFEDVTESAGVRGRFFGQGVAVGDYDNDGFPDIYLTNLGENALYRNRRDGTFEDVTRAAGVRGGGWSAGAGFIDYDRDGLLDLIVARYLDWSFAVNPWCGDRKPHLRSYCHPKYFAPIGHLAYRNRGDGTFEDVSGASGLGKAPGKGLGVAFQDFDQDGWIDVLIANDSFPQQLFQNHGDGTFEELGLLAGVAYDEDGKTFAGMGVDFADYDNDGRPDVFINALANERYALYRNLGDLFEYVSGPSGVGSISALHSGWGTKFFDYDNDGRKDIFVAQGHVMDNIELTQPDSRYEEPLALMRNTPDGFVDVSESSGAPFQMRLAARGAAVGDLDNDGFLDIAVNCNDRPAVILRNKGGLNNWISFNVVGSRSNRDGAGVHIRLVSKSGLEQYAMASTASSYLSASDKRIHFGLGRDSVSLVEIKWPSGTVQRLEGTGVNQIVKVEEPLGE